MKAFEASVRPVHVLQSRPVLPKDTLMSWVHLAERQGFNAVLPLIEKAGIDVVNCALANSAIDWLFLAGVSSWRKALLIGSDLGAAVEALGDLFEKLEVVEPNDSVRRLLEIRFRVEIAAGRIATKARGLDDKNRDYDLLWFMPMIGRSRGCLPLTEELKSLLRDCAERLAPRGLLIARVVRDRGLLRNIPLPGIRHEPGRGYSLPEFDRVFDSTDGKARGTVEWYWLTSPHSGRSYGTRLQNYKAIAYCIRKSSRHFRFMGPLAEIGASLVSKRVSSLMLAFRKSGHFYEAHKTLLGIQPDRSHEKSTLGRVVGAVREQYHDKRHLIPFLHTSVSPRRGSYAMYYLVEPKFGCPLYVVRIAKSPQSELRLRREREMYVKIRETNAALKSLSAVHYVVSGETATASVSDAHLRRKHDSFSVERFFEGVTGAAFAKNSSLDAYSFDWLNWFQKESIVYAGGEFDKHALRIQLSSLKDAIFGHAEHSEYRRCELLKRLFSDLEYRYEDIQPFRLPLTAVHGDFSQVNMLAHAPQQEKDGSGQRRSLPIQCRESGPIRARGTPNIHVFDWEYLDAGVPLLDPWLYVIGYMYITVHGRLNNTIIHQFVTGTWGQSGRVQQCLAYYAAISKVPPDLLGGYLPVALLTLYARELERSPTPFGSLALFRETILSMAANRSAVWKYLDALTEQLRKESHP